MMMTLFLLLVVLFGYGLVLVLAVNIAHGLRFHGRRAELVTLAALGGSGAVGLGFALWVLFGHPWRTWPWPVAAYGVVCGLVALVGLPVTTLLRSFRRVPEGISGRECPAPPPDPGSSARRSWWHRLPGNESLDLSILDWRVPVRGLPDELAGLRIVHLTDWHMSPLYDRRFFEHVVDQANRLDPDLVLFTGDLVEHKSAIEWVEPVLGRLTAKIGKLAILGNHDLLYGLEAVKRAVEAAGFEDVDGRWSVREASGRTVAVGGTSAPWGPKLNPAARPDADLTIVLSHSPDQFYRIASWDSAHLVLAGHNHGGQVRLPVFGPVLMPSRYSRRFDRGFFLRGRTWMYVSQGLGAKHPVRYRCRPELTRIVLQNEPVPVAHRTARSGRRGFVSTGAALADHP